MEQTGRLLITGYLVIVNLIGFAAMGIDKHKAIKKAWRIPERTLLFIALIGGGIGAFLGMYSFRHKTKHIRFIVLLPLTAAIYMILILKLYQII